MFYSYFTNIPTSPMANKQAIVQKKTRHRAGDKSLSVPMMI